MAIGKVVGMSTGASRFFQVHLPTQKDVLIYDGTLKSPTWTFLNMTETSKIDDYFEITSPAGSSSDTTGNQTKAGTYTVVMRPKGVYVWSDTLAQGEKEVTWTINKADIPTMPEPDAFTFSLDDAGQPKTFAQDFTGTANFDIYFDKDGTEKANVNNLSASAAGTYKRRIKPKDNYKWSSALKAGNGISGDNDYHTLTWTISKKAITVPYFNGDNETPYNRNQQTISIAATEHVGTGTSAFVTQTLTSQKHVDGTALASGEAGATLTGNNLSATDTGKYTITWHLLFPQSTYWAGEAETSNLDKSQTWTIKKLTNTLTIKNYNDQSTTYATNAEIKFGLQGATLISQWDGLIETLNTNTAPTVTITSGANVIETSTPSKISSTNDYKFSISIKGSFTEESGQASFTIKHAESRNFTGPNDVVINIKVENYTVTLSKLEPGTIKSLITSGGYTQCFQIGDITAPIKLGEGPLKICGRRQFDKDAEKYEWAAYILAFDHRVGLETPAGKGSIHFCLGKARNKVAADETPNPWRESAFVDDLLYTTGDSAAFRMNLTNSNAGGWSSCFMRTSICRAFYSCLPTAWQTVIAGCTKWTDNVGGSSNSAENVKATVDHIWLLAEFEIFGQRSYANSSEQNSQQWYAYYSTYRDSTYRIRGADRGNNLAADYSTVRNGISYGNPSNAINPGDAVHWWERSPSNHTLIEDGNKQTVWLDWPVVDGHGRVYWDTCAHERYRKEPISYLGTFYAAGETMHLNYGPNGFVPNFVIVG